MILHVDMDAFYAAVEQQDNPLLKGKPLIVGGRSKRAVVTTASYEARAYGVRSAMPMYQAVALCPEAIVIPGRMSRYKEISAQIMKILAAFSPLMEQVSIDEAFLDIHGMEKLFGSPEAIAAAIKHTIRSATGLGCSIGIAPLKFLAKIASDLDKPDGLTILGSEDITDFIEKLPLKKVPGVGPKALAHLRTLGLNTLGDVKSIPEKRIMDKIGKFGMRLIALAHGLDDAAVEPDRPVKSVSAEHTLPENISDPDVLKKYMLFQSETVGRALRRSGLRARTITLKIKYHDFKLVTRSETLAKPVQTSKLIYASAVRLLSQKQLLHPVRLVGVGASHLLSEKTPLQQDLFDTDAAKNGKWERVDRAVDQIIKKFGKDTIRKAALDDPDTP